MDAVRLCSPATSESSTVIQNSPFPASRVMNLSFRQPVDDYKSSSDDEFELSLPEDDSEPESSPVVRKTSRSSYYRRSSVWPSDRLLAIEENTCKQAASALLGLKQTRITTTISFHSDFADSLSSIFELANLHLQDAQRRKPSVEEESSAQLSGLRRRQEEFERDAETSISQFLAEQKRKCDAEEAAAKKAQKQREEAAKLEAERIAKQKQAQQAAEDARRKEEEEAAHETQRASAVELDTSTLWPAGQVKSVSSLQRFCQNRAKMFFALEEQAKNAPFNPDRQLFLQCNEILNRFAPTAESVTSTVREITAVLSLASYRLDIHICNMAISYLKQVQNKVFQNPNYALGFARLWKALGTAMPRIAIITMAAFFSRCPPAALKLIPSEQEHTPAQSGSLRALLRVFCCYIQRSDEQASSFAWNWLSSICSLPVTVLTAPSLLMFFEVSQILKFRFFERYGKQGRKLIVYVAKNVVGLLPAAAGNLSTDVENLKTFFDQASLKKIPERSYILNCLTDV